MTNVQKQMVTVKKGSNGDLKLREDQLCLQLSDPAHVLNDVLALAS